MIAMIPDPVSISLLAEGCQGIGEGDVLVFAGIDQSMGLQFTACQAATRGFAEALLHQNRK